MLHNGLKRAVKSVLRRVVFNKNYYDILENISGKRLRQFSSTITFVIGDPKSENYELPSNQYDLIVSNAVSQHVSDVTKFAKEVSRMLVQSGFFYGIIHNFYSLSGGHNMELAYPDEFPSSRVPPWDHLSTNLYPTFVYLNRLRPEEYYSAFAKHLKVLLFEGRDINHDPGGFEGERFLTEEIKNELSMFNRDLLLTRSFCIICLKV